MADLRIRYTDLHKEALRGSLPTLVGRESEAKRLSRTLVRSLANNAIVIGPAGSGKTAFLFGWAGRETKRHGGRLPFVQFDARHLGSLGDDQALASCEEALRALPESVILIDGFGRAVFRKSDVLQRAIRLYEPLLKSRRIRLVISCEPAEYAWLEREASAFVRAFEPIELREQDDIAQILILSGTLARLRGQRTTIVPDTALHEIIANVRRFPMLGSLPAAAVKLLDESLALATYKNERLLSEDTIAEVVEARTGVPRASLAGNALLLARDLEPRLKERVLGQDRAIETIAATLRRAKLGLKNPDRPLGSFLLLGPSGVGKTETAKAVAELLFGKPGSFVRFDMSEFQQEHTAQRLIGAPAGYVGFEEGGALTSALKRNPHSLILLDEIEKAHPKVFDIFLQILDDGRLTSGQNETMDARECVVMATSNAGVSTILETAGVRGELDERFLRNALMPELTKTFRMEFLNRFDAIVLFNPLSQSLLFDIAQLEIRKIEKRLEKHGAAFSIEPEELRLQIERIADDRFGARPVKRFIEETCETLLMESLIA